MNLNTHFSGISSRISNKYLTENGLFIEFSASKKLYYSVARRVLPIKIRQYLQSKFNAGVIYKDNFINSEYVDIVRETAAFEKESLNLYPENHKTAIILTHDVEEQNGFDNIPRIIDEINKFGFRASWNIVPYRYRIDEGIINYIKEAGHEIGIHGYNHDGRLYYSEKMFRERAQYINEAIMKYGAVGFRSPQVHRNLLWLQGLNIDYDASCFDYDPFQPFPGGVGTIWPFIAGKFVELPYTLPQDHVVFYVLKKRDIEIWKNKVDWLVENRGMILSITHPDYLVERDHLNYYKELLAYLKEIKNPWHCLPREMAEWYKNLASNLLV